MKIDSTTFDSGKKNINKVFQQNFLDFETKNRPFWNIETNLAKKILAKIPHIATFKNVVLIGVGGSALGTQAWAEIFPTQKKLIVFDSFDCSLHNLPKNLNETFFIAVSKSGETFETTYWLKKIVECVIEKKIDKPENIAIVTAFSDSTIGKIAQKNNFVTLEMNPDISGRFSVFSMAGIAPLLALGIDVKSISEEAHIYKKLAKNDTHLQKIFEVFTVLYTEPKNVPLWGYGNHIHYFLLWFQQLLAESLGKENRGFLPFVCRGGQDQHSLLQLFSEGPKSFFCFFFQDISRKNKYLTQQKLATAQSLKEKNREMAIIDLDFKDVRKTTRSFFQIMTLVGVLGEFSKINAYNQTGVERAKEIFKEYF